MTLMPCSGKICVLAILGFLVAGSAAPNADARVRMSNPEHRRIELNFRAGGIRIEEPTAELHVWMAEPVPGVGQSDTRRVSIAPRPTEIFDDPENGNRILYWNLSPALLEGTTLEIRREYELTSWHADGVPGPEEYIEPPDPGSELVRFYTKNERWLEQSDTVSILAAQVTRDWEQPWDKVVAIFHWVKGSCEYVYPPPGGERGAWAMLRERKGDCGQYACLFIDLCRAAGIPARFVAGMTFNKDGRVGHHAWAEVWLPEYEWIPCDPTGPREDPVGTIGANRMVTTRGLNIPLPHVPPWATYKNSEVAAEGEGGAGRTEFIQNACVAARGIRADFSTRRSAEKVLPGDGVDKQYPSETGEE